jgi:hypothetical protein
MKRRGTGCRRFISKFNTTVLIVALLLLLGAAVAQAAKADECEDNAIITVTGFVGEIYPNQAGTWTIPVAHPTYSCIIAPAIISEDRPPDSCYEGAKLTAIIRISVDDLIGFVSQKELIELTCE